MISPEYHSFKAENLLQGAHTLRSSGSIAREKRVGAAAALPIQKHADEVAALEEPNPLDYCPFTEEEISEHSLLVAATLGSKMPSLQEATGEDSEEDAVLRVGAHFLGGD